MPKLPTRSANIEGGAIAGGRRASAEDFASADLGGGVRAIQNAAEGFLQAKEEDESRKVLVSQAEIRAKYAKRLDEATTSGEDVTKIREELDNDLAQVGEGLVTKKGSETAQLHAANTGAIFDNQANQIQVQRAALTARVEGAKFLNATGALVTANPSYLPQAEQDVNDFVATLSKVPPAERERIATNLKQNLNVAAAMRQAQLDPEGTRKAVQGGAYFLDPGQRQQVINEAEREKRAQDADKERERMIARRDEDDRINVARGQMLDGIIKGNVRWADIRDNPAFAGPQGANAKKELFLMMESRNKELAGGEKRSNPAVERNLWMAINAPEGDPRKVYTSTPIFEAVQRGDINTSTANQLNAMVANQKDENNRTLGSRLYGMSNDLGQALRTNTRVQGRAYNNPMLIPEIQNEYRARVEERIAVLRKDGKDPSAVFTRGDKNYVGDPAFVNGIIDSVMSQSQRTTAGAAAQAEVVTFPDGVARQWSGKGDITDVKTWVPANTAPAKPIRGPN